MKPTQSSPVPAKGQKPQFRDLPWLARFGMRGLWELVKARIAFMRFAAREIPQRNKTALTDAGTGKVIDDAELARIAYVLPRLSDRLPWRSDCLIQAIAGQSWLTALGAASEIQIGIENPKDGDFGAHAWLDYDGRVITGGNIEQYQVILSESRLDGDSHRPSQPDEPA